MYLHGVRSPAFPYFLFPFCLARGYYMQFNSLHKSIESFFLLFFPFPLKINRLEFVDLDEYSFAFVGLSIGVKERMILEDIYVLSHSGSILYSPPPKPFSYKLPNRCGCLFMKVQFPLPSTL